MKSKRNDRKGNRIWNVKMCGKNMMRQDVKKYLLLMKDIKLSFQNVKHKDNV